MGKNKARGKKPKSVFQVATKPLKVKNKAKPVTTALTHLRVAKSEKVEKLNQIFSQLQREAGSAPPQPAAVTRPPPAQVVPRPPREAVNVDSAAQLFAQLGRS